MIFSLLRRWTGQRIGTKPCSNRSTRSTKQVRSTAIGRGHYFNQPLWWKTVHARRACLYLCACLFACQFLLNLKCQNRSKPELIRWEHEIVERRKNWVKPLIDSELSWEICSHFVGSAESHRRHKACLFRAAQAFSSLATYSYTCPGDGTGLDETFFYARSKRAPIRKEKCSVPVNSFKVYLVIL